MTNTIKQKIAHAFSKAVSTYDEAAFIQYEIGNRLIERLSYINFTPTIILDLGAGTGFLTEKIQKLYPAANICSLDISLDMLKFAKTKQTNNSNLYIQADAEILPLATHSVDFIFSNCTLQWCFNLQQTFKELFRILKPGGLFLFSCFGPNTLIELKTAWQNLDNFNHVNKFYDMHTIGDVLKTTKFTHPVMDMQSLCVEYEEVLTLLTDLKNMGANVVTNNQQNSLITKNKIQKLSAEYANFKTKNNTLPATFEAIYGHACAPTTLKPQNLPISTEFFMPAKKKKITFNT